MSNFIIQAVLDVYYTSSYPSGGFIGDLYKIGYKNVIETPFRNIPKEIREKNPDFKFQPMYEATCSDTDYKVSIGDNNFGVSTKNYNSWSDFIEHAKKIFDVLFSQKDAELSITRIGLRYIDLIEGKNIFDEKHITIEISGHSKNKANIINLRFDNEIEDCRVTESIIYPFAEQNDGESGTFIDIITAKENLEISGDDIKKAFFDISDRLHRVNKDHFKEVLSDELRKQIGL